MGSLDDASSDNSLQETTLATIRTVSGDWDNNNVSTTIHPGLSAFTSSGTFTAPGGVGQVVIEMWGAGGGGGFKGSYSGGGGGGGVYATTSVPVTAGQSYTATVGSGGSGGASIASSGSSGGSTTFVTWRTTFTAAGGGGGAYGAGSIGAGGAAGNSSGSNCTLAFNGEAGAAGNAVEAGGGAVITTHGKYYGTSNLGTNTSAGYWLQAHETRQGVGGPGDNSGSGNQRGWDGGDGLVIVRW